MIKEIRHAMAQEVFEQRATVLSRGFTAKNYSIKMHDHDFYEINIVLSGKGIHLIGSRKIEVGIGDVFVIPPGTVHGYENIGGGFNVYHVIVRTEFFEKYSSELAEFSGFRLLFEVEPYLRQRSGKAYLRLDYEALGFLGGCLELFESLKNDDSAEADTLRSTLALTVIGYLSRRTYAPLAEINSKNADDLAIAVALEYIHKNISESLNLDFLASICKMSRATFIRKFKGVCGIAPHGYILNHRLSAARRLLERGCSMTETAHECGFYDASHLCKLINDKSRLCK